MTHNEERVARLAEDLGFRLWKISKAGVAGSLADSYCLEGQVDGHPHLHNTSLSRVAFFLIERATDGGDP